MKKGYRSWRVVQSVELGASAAKVWSLIGGFYTLHHWHPDIQLTEIPSDQTDTGALRRILTFPGQPKTTEELVSMDNADMHCTYKWHAGKWGERVQNYHASLRVLELVQDRTCVVQWSSTFNYTEDALSEFYWNGFRALQQRWPLPA